MATYVVGDIQGCLKPLRALLKQVNFDRDKDFLWAAGDIVNRGPDSLDTLRFVYQLPNFKMVLGNHDLHLLAVAQGHKQHNPKDTLKAILEAADGPLLLDWLRRQPLVHHDREFGYTMVHAGIPPIWDHSQALECAKEVESVLQSDRVDEFFSHMYGNKPAVWSNELEGPERWRIITNYFTRMRFCDAAGHLDLKAKGGPETAPPGYLPWFKHAEHRCRDHRILFGHWASLEGKSDVKNFIALDTGCVWGGALTMMRLDDGKFFQVSA